MSFDSIRWALAQPVEKSSSKFVLVAMASCVNGEAGDMQCWPSVQHLASTTGQDRKTVIDGLRRLRDAGFIVDTGERKGTTGQVPVYRLNSTKPGTFAEANPREPGYAEPPEQGESKGPEIGTCTESGTVPKPAANSTVSPHKDARISASTVPETGHGTRNEQVMNQEGSRKKSSGFDASLIDLPEWLDRDDWHRWCRDRKARGKAITPDAASLQLRKLRGYRESGFSPVEVIDNSIAGGYQGLFPPKRAERAASGRPTSHTGLADKDFSQGVTSDGRLI